MSKLNKINDAIQAGAAYLDTFVGKQTILSYSDSTGWAVCNNTGLWINEKRFLICQDDIHIDEEKLLLWREEYIPKGSCPACNGSDDEEAETGVYRCRACGCLHGTVYLGESYKYVLPHMTDDPEADKRAIPYDFECLGSEGITRRHGWYDPQTRLITQVG